VTTPPIPRVSLLLPCRDVETHLDRCIASIEAQTESRWEALVLDDGSRDGTLARLGAWCEQDARVRRVEADRRGLVPALDALVAASRAPFLARMDADDAMRPRRLAAQLGLLDARPAIAACGTRVRYVPRRAVGSGYRRYETWLNGLVEPADLARDLFVECPIAHPTLMIRAPILESMGGYREFEGPEDYDLVLRLAERGHAMANVPEVLLDWSLGDGRTSERSPRYAPEAFRRLKIEHLRRWALPDRPLVLWGAGRVGKAFLRSWLATGGRPVEALVDLDPRKIGQTIHGSPVVDPAALAARRTASPTPYVLVAVGSPGAREEIREALAAMGATEPVDVRAVA